jgi:hypothetical protein
MSIPVDTAKARFMAADNPSPALDYTTKVPKVDQNGQPIWIVPTIVMSEGHKGTIVNIRVPGEPKGVRAFGFVKITGFYISVWEKGAFYDAERVEPEAAARA